MMPGDRPMGAEGLRVGILCAGEVFQRWQADAIRAVMAVPGVHLVLIVEHERIAVPAPSLIQRILRHPWRIALYLAWRRRWFKPAAMGTVDLSTDLRDIPRMRCRVEQRGYGQYFGARDIEVLRGKRLDVLLRFGFNILRGEILEVPRHGVWSFHHGDELKYRGGPPGFWEIMNDEPVTGAVLQRLTDRLDAGIILRKGWFKTIDHSLEETVDTLLAHTAHWPAQVCQDLLTGRADAARGEPSDTTAPIRRYPTNTTFIRFLWRRMKNKARFHHEELKRHDEWNIGVLYQPIHALLDERPSLNVRWLPSPSKGAYRADPFGYITSDGQLNVLYEKYDYARGTGEISRLRPKRDNILKRSRTMLASGTHLSYPYVVAIDGAVHVIPESAAAGRVDLYRLTADNDALEHVRTLLDEPLVDPTLFEHDGRWWLFGTRAPLTNVALHAFHATHPFGPFTPHALNPIKLDIRSARPAGTPFRHGGDLYRPAQDSSAGYGHRIALNCVHELTPTSFREEVARYVGPIKGAYGHGFHTISSVGDITLVDGKRYVRDRSQESRVRRRKWDRVRGRDDEDDEE